MIRPFTAEIIGPAGAGKSTLAGLLRGRDATIKTGLSIWGLPLHLLGTSAFFSLPDLVSLFGRRRFSLEDLKLVVQINALRRLLGRESEKGYQALVLDEGGVFGLTKLRAFGAGSLATDSITWMSSLFNQVGPTLDAVIWLDAPDAVLARRIRERDKPHRTKHLPEAEMCEYLARYRAAFERVMSELTQRNSVKVIKFRTDREPLEDIANRILAAAGGEI
jgi:broad-specificity NMP kinase